MTVASASWLLNNLSPVRSGSQWFLLKCFHIRRGMLHPWICVCFLKPWRILQFYLICFARLGDFLICCPLTITHLCHINTFWERVMINQAKLNVSKTNFSVCNINVLDFSFLRIDKLIKALLKDWLEINEKRTGISSLVLKELIKSFSSFKCVSVRCAA